MKGTYAHHGETLTELKPRKSNTVVDHAENTDRTVWTSQVRGVKFSKRQQQFREVYLPFRRPLGNSPTVWESVLSKPTPFALIILGLWPDWWKKTLRIINILVITTINPAVNNSPAMQSPRRDLCRNINCTPGFVQLWSERLSWQQQTMLTSMHFTACTAASHTNTEITRLCMRSGHRDLIVKCMIVLVEIRVIWQTKITQCYYRNDHIKSKVTLVRCLQTQKMHGSWWSNWEM